MQFTIESIKKTLDGQPTVEECSALTRACEPLRVERRARLAEITPAYPGLPITKQQQTFREAFLRDPRALKEEQERLRMEISQLDALESMVTEAHEAALDARARVEIPKAVRKLPALVGRLQKAITEVDAAIADINVHMEIVGDFARLPNSKLPYDDSQLAALLNLRNSLWQPRILQVVSDLMPNEESEKKYGKSWPLVFERRRDGHTITTRRPPIHVDLTTIGAATYR